MSIGGSQGKIVMYVIDGETFRFRLYRENTAEPRIGMFPVTDPREIGHVSRASKLIEGWVCGVKIKGNDESAAYEEALRKLDEVIGQPHQFSDDVTPKGVNP